MCIIFWATNTDGYALILAANRDEFLARPTTTAAWHTFPHSSNAPTHASADALPSTCVRSLSGLDLTAGGTWLGLSIPPASLLDSSPAPNTPLLKFSTLTNFAETPEGTARTGGRALPSRGALARDFLTSPASVSAEGYLSELRPRLEEYAGCNLLCGELTAGSGFEMAYATNRSGKVEEGGPVADRVGSKGKVIGLSNSTLGATEDKSGRWPKVQSGCSQVERLVAETAHSGEESLIAGLWQILSTSHPTPVTHRSHLRHTILVRPAFFSPKLMELPPAPLPFPAAAPDGRDPTDLPPAEELQQEGQGGAWYATRVQTLVLIRTLPDGGHRVTFIERDGCVLAEDGKPRWSGAEHIYHFEV